MKTARLLLFSIMAALANCTEKGKPIVTHEGDQRREEAAVSTRSERLSETRAIDSSDLNGLAAQVLSEARVRDLKSYSDRDAHDGLRALNEQLLRTPQGERAKILPILKNYVAMLELECSSIKASCLGLKYFKGAGSSAEVAKMLAQMPEFESRAARLLLFAVELKNDLADHALLRLLIEKVPPSNPTLHSLLETALVSASKNLQSEAKLREFLTSVKAWELTDQRKWTLGPGAQSALWSAIGRARLMYGPEGELAPEFTAQVEKLNAEPGSLAREQKSLLEKKTLIPQAMGARPVLKFDELYFLVDAVFMQKLSPQVAAELFHHSRRSPIDLAATIENYVRLRFVLGVAEANAAAKEIFTAAVPTEQLLTHAIRQSSLVRQVWGGLNTRLDIVKSFASTALKPTSEGREYENKLRATFHSFGRSVNLVSVYPQMLLLFQMLSQKRFKLKLHGIGEVDSGHLMPLIFNGTTPPLLNYSDETAALNHFEIMHAFDMAVRSRMFAAMNIEPDEFMADVLSRLNQVPSKFIATTLDTVEKRFSETILYQNLKHICQEMKGGPAVNRVQDLTGLRSSAYFGGTMDMLFTGMTSRGSRGGGGLGSLQQLEMGLFYADGEYSEALERVRLDLAQYERVAQAMLASYTGYLKNYEHLSDIEVAKRTLKTRNQLNLVSRLRARAMKTASDWFGQIGWCYYKAAQKDYEMMNAVLRMEEKHLRSVHRDMQRLRQEGLSETEKQNILASHQFTGLPSGFKGLDRISKDAYTMTSIDFLIRSGFSIQQLSPNIQLNFGSRLDMDVSHVREALVRQVQFTASEQSFVEAGLQAIFLKRDPFVLWQSLAGGRINMWQNILKTMMTGYRLESEARGKAVTFTPERILEIHEDILRLTQLTGEDRHFFSVLRETERFHPLYLNSRILSYTVDEDKGTFVLQHIWSLFDLPVMFANFEKLGYDYDQTQIGPNDLQQSYRLTRYGHLELGRLYFNARSSWVRGAPIVPYNLELDHFLDGKVMSTVREGIRATQEFHKATVSYLAKAAQRPPALRPRADLNMDQSITSLLSDNLIPSYEAELQQFRQATQNCFASPCGDFK